MEKAAEQCIQQRQTVVMLVPEDMSVGWFSKALESVDEVRIITDGRINFIEPSTGLEKKGNSKGSMLLIWRPFISPSTDVYYRIQSGIDGDRAGRQEGRHEATATKYHRHHLRKLQLPSNETLQKQTQANPKRI